MQPMKLLDFLKSKVNALRFGINNVVDVSYANIESFWKFNDLASTFVHSRY